MIHTRRCCIPSLCFDASWNRTRTHGLGLINGDFASPNHCLTYDPAFSCRWICWCCCTASLLPRRQGFNHCRRDTPTASTGVDLPVSGGRWGFGGLLLCAVGHNTRATRPTNARTPYPGTQSVYVSPTISRCGQISTVERRKPNLPGVQEICPHKNAGHRRENK